MRDEATVTPDLIITMRYLSNVSEICHRRRHRRTRIKNQSDEINKLTMSNEYNKVLSPTPATALYSIVYCGKHPSSDESNWT